MAFAREPSIVRRQNLSLVRRIGIKEMKAVSEDKFKKSSVIGRKEKCSLSNTQGQRLALLFKKYRRK